MKIKGITINLNGKDEELTMEEAKALHQALQELFGKVVINHQYDTWWYPTYPYYGRTRCFPGSNPVYLSASNSTGDNISLTKTAGSLPLSNRMTLTAKVDDDSNSY